MTDFLPMIIAGLAIFFGGLMKGVVGIGAPLVATPVIAHTYDVPTAIAVMTVSLAVSSFWQAWEHRRAPIARNTLLLLLGGCALGVLVGTHLLGVTADAWLEVVLAILVFAYVAVHVTRPDLGLSARAALRAALPVGLTTGVLQGTTGVSTPVSVTFVLAQGLKRDPYLLETQSIFTVMAVAQMIALSVYGIMTPQLATASLAGLVPMMAGVWLGQRIANHVSNRLFEVLTLIVMSLIAASLLFRALPEIFA
jgi:uncharacterized membrane protein YfcA